MLQTIRSAVDSLRSVLQELEGSSDHWELVGSDDVAAPQPSRGPLAGLSASASGRQP